MSASFGDKFVSIPQVSYTTLLYPTSLRRLAEARLLIKRESTVTIAHSCVEQL